MIILETGTTGLEKLARRNSDSVAYLSSEELPVLKLKRVETELEYYKSQIASMQKEVEKFFSEILGPYGPEEKATFKHTPEEWQGEKCCSATWC